MKKRFSDKLFEVAGFRFRLRMDTMNPLWNEIGRYDCFVTESDDPASEDVLFTLTVDGLMRIPSPEPVYSELTEGPGGHTAALYAETGGWCFTIIPPRKSTPVFSLHTDFTYAKARLRICRYPSFGKYALDNALMLLFALKTGRHGFLLIRSAVVEKFGSGYAFLGWDEEFAREQCRLWQEHVPDARFMADGFVAFSVQDGVLHAYSTPWACDADVPCTVRECVIKSIVWIYRDQSNTIKKADALSSLASVYKGAERFRLGAGMTDSIMKNSGQIMESVPFYLLGCQSVAESAIMCNEFLTS